MESERKYNLIRLFSGEQIEERATQMGEQIARDYEGKDVHVILVQLGALMFGSTLARRIHTERLTLDSIQLSSYNGTEHSCGMVTVVRELVHPVENRHVLVVEDIVDTGRTMTLQVGNLKRRGAASVRVASMLDKPGRRKIDFKPDYVGFEIPSDKFIVGYGLDYQERLRNLPHIYHMVFDKD